MTLCNFFAIIDQVTEMVKLFEGVNFMTIKDFRKNLVRELYPNDIKEIFKRETQKMLDNILGIIQKFGGGKRFQLLANEYLSIRITIFSQDVEDYYMPADYEISRMRCGSINISVDHHKFPFSNDLFLLRTCNYQFKSSDSVNNSNLIPQKFQLYQELWLASFLVSFFKEHHIETKVTYDNYNKIAFLDLRITPAWLF